MKKIKSTKPSSPSQPITLHLTAAQCAAILLSPRQSDPYPTAVYIIRAKNISHIRELAIF